MVLFFIGGVMTLPLYIIETFIIYPKIFKKIGKKSDKAQSLAQRAKYIEFYRTICEQETSSLFFYNSIFTIDKYAKILVKIVFFLGFLKIASLLIIGFLTGKLKYVG